MQRSKDDSIKIRNNQKADRHMDSKYCAHEVSDELLARIGLQVIYVTIWQRIYILSMF